MQSVGPNSAAAKAGLLPTRRGLTGIVTGAAAKSLLHYYTFLQSLLYQKAGFSQRAFAIVHCTSAKPNGFFREAAQVLAGAAALF